MNLRSDFGAILFSFCFDKSWIFCCRLMALVTFFFCVIDDQGRQDRFRRRLFGTQNQYPLLGQSVTSLRPGEALWTVLFETDRPLSISGRICSSPTIIGTPFPVLAREKSRLFGTVAQPFLALLVIVG